MFGIGMTELAIIFVIALLVLGPTKLPQVAKSIGKGLRELRRASDDLRSAVMFDDEPEQRYRPPPPPAAAQLPAHRAEDEDAAEAEPAITGSAAAAPGGTVARGSSLEDERDPDDADDHGDMPYAPDSPELDQLLSDARARAGKRAPDEIQEAELEPPGEKKESA